MLVLGCVKEVHEYDMILSLPNGVTGIVPITEISDAYHDQLRLLASHGEEEGMEDLVSMMCAFH
jgi:ribosomal protein S1